MAYTSPVGRKQTSPTAGGGTLVNSLPYLRGASEGERKVYKNQNIDQYKPYSEEYKKRLQDDSDRAASFYAGSKDAINKNPNNYGGGLKFGNVRQEFQGNGNPMLMKGMTSVDINGSKLDIPNALAQQLMFTSYVNQGRYDPGEFFGLGAGGWMSNPNAMYTDWTVAQDRINKLSKERGLLGEGAVNPYHEWRRKSAELSQQITQARSELGYRKEVRTNTGQIVSDTGAGAEERLRNALAAQSRLGQNPGNRSSGGINWDEFRVRPTTANLMITEKVIDSKK